MICIKCSNDTAVTNSRPHKKTPSVWRRRSCKACGLTFTTQEVVSETDYQLMVKRKNGVVDQFSFAYLMLSVCRSFAHRQDDIKTANDAYWLTTTVSKDIQESGVDTIEVGALALLTHQTISRFDAVAGIAYGAKHRMIENTRATRRGRPRTTRIS